MNIINLEIKRGKVFIGDYYNYDKINADLYICCSSCQETSPEGTLLVEQLSPSYELEVQINSWINSGLLEVKKDSIKDLYKDELYERTESKKALNKLIDLIKAGKKIVLFDNYYGNSKFSHLSIVKDILTDLGIRTNYIKSKDLFPKNTTCF